MGKWKTGAQETRLLVKWKTSNNGFMLACLLYRTCFCLFGDDAMMRGRMALEAHWRKAGGEVGMERLIVEWLQDLGGERVDAGHEVSEKKEGGT